MDDERMDAKIAGRMIGTASGWDQIDTNFIVLYDFHAADGIKIPNGDLAVDYDGGRFEIANDNGDVQFEADIVSLLASVSAEAA